MGRPKKRKRPAGPKAKHIRPSTVAKIQRLSAEALTMRRRERDLDVKVTEFHEIDLPAFEKWVDVKFPAERKEIREVLEEVETHHRIFEEAEMGYFRGDHRTEAAALRAAKKRVEASRRQPEKASGANGGDPAEDEAHPEEPFSEMPDDMMDFLFDTFMAEVRGVFVDDMDEKTYEDARADFVSTFDHVKNGNRAAFEKALLKAGADKSQGNLDSVKAAYRRLAKRLHPDHNGELDESEKALWHDASLCYQALDREGLEEIDLILSLERHEPIAPGQFESLKRLHQRTGDRLADLEGDLEECVDHPAWQFTKRKETKAFVSRIREDLADGLEFARSQLSELRRMIDRILKPRSGKRKPAKKKRAASKTKRPAKKAATSSSQEMFPF